jgi:hypothetical protein
MKTATLAIPLALLLGGCAVSDPQRSAAPTSASEAVTSSPVQRPRVGVIESASVASLPSASAGGTTVPTMAYRLRMEDGSTLGVMFAGERFEVGDRVEITSDGRLTRR